MGRLSPVSRQPRNDCFQYYPAKQGLMPDDRGVRYSGHPSKSAGVIQEGPEYPRKPPFPGQPPTTGLPHLHSDTSCVHRLPAICSHWLTNESTTLMGATYRPSNCLDSIREQSTLSRLQAFSYDDRPQLISGD